MLMKPLTTACTAPVDPDRAHLRFPSPRGYSGQAWWTGTEFVVDGHIERILSYDSGASGWTEELTELHEGVDDEDHYMSVASREQAVGSIERWLDTPAPVILDVGCSTGYTLGLLRHRMPHATLMGADCVRRPLEKLGAAIADLPLFQFDITNCPLESNSVDGVVLLNILEHIENDARAAQQIHRILKPGGVAVIEVPAGPDLYDIYDERLLHFRRYSLLGITDLMHQAGLEIVQSSHLGFFFYPAFWWAKRRNRKLARSAHEIRQAVIDRDMRRFGHSRALHALMAFERGLGRSISYPVGIRCNVTCRKPHRPSPRARALHPLPRVKVQVSILIPVYNEVELVATVVKRTLAAPIADDVTFEVIAVDDGSTDGSSEVLEELRREYPQRLTVLHHERNRGKGAAIRTALEHACGEFVVVQDCDLEYSPQDLPALLRPLLQERADAVFGSRFMVSGERRVLYFWHSLANMLLTTLCNIVADLNLSDMETGYKAFRRSLLTSIPLHSEGFGIEPELTVKMAQRGIAIYEVPISYHGRTYEEGKKVRLKDAFEAVWMLLYYGLRRDIYQDEGARILDALAQTPKFNKWMADTIVGYVGRRVLEIGAGIGNLSQHLSRRRQSYVATDIDAEHLARLNVRFQHRPHMTIRRCDLGCRADFEDLQNCFDTVVCLNVLEHVLDDATSLENIASALVPGGTAIILVPQDQRIYGTLDEVLGHHRRYSEEELRSKMEAAGFHVETVLHFNRITRPGWFLNGRILKRRSFGRVQLWIFDRLVWLWKGLEKVLPWPSVSLIAIGKRK
jgi:glycosyltransferase involved in cell wall biosynthesis/ubiquinone/menaquinone biosynthesis C-methylase UbiE